MDPVGLVTQPRADWVLHVGMPKSGSTSFQSHLWHLVRQGGPPRPIPTIAVSPLYPESGASALLAWWCQPERWEEFDSETRASLEDLPNRIQAYAQDPGGRGSVLSSELLFWELRTEEHFARLGVLLHGLVSHIVIVCRDPLHVARTLWLTHLVEGVETRSFESWLVPNAKHLSKVDDWLERASATLGCASAIPVEYSTTVVEDLCAILSLPAPSAELRHRDSAAYVGLGDVFLALANSPSPRAGEIRSLIVDHLQRG